MRVTVGVIELGAVARDVALFRKRRRAKHRDDVEQAAASKRVMNDVEAGAGPQHHLVPVHVRMNVCHRHDGAMRDIAHHAWLGFGEHLRAYR